MEASVASSAMEWTRMALEAAGKDVTVEKFAKALREMKYADKFGTLAQSPAEGNHAQTVAADRIKGGKWVKISDWITAIE
jgi:hypothetical protein